MDIGVNSLNSPLVSVIIPAHNAEHFVEQTLRSVLSQTYKHIEVLVVDNRSQDKTADIVKSVAQHDDRVMLLQQSQLGVAATRNLAIQKSSGELIAPIDADDIWHPQNLEKQVQCMLQADASVGVVYAWSVDIDEDGCLTGGCRASAIEGNVYRTLLSHYFLGNASASLIRRVCFEKVGYYNTQFLRQNAQGCEDWELYLRIAKYYKFRVVPEFLIGYRRTINSMSRDYRTMERSHHLMLEYERQENTNIPEVIYHLSTINMYIYFAHQSFQFGSSQNALYWARRALRSNFMMTLISYRLYTLLIGMILKRLDQTLTHLNLPVPHFKKKSQRQFRISDGLIRVSNITKKQPSVRFRLLIERIYHQLIMII